MKEKVYRNDRIIVTNIQRMCMHDGPGIRTTIFLKGCNLHCPWCANPENISMKLQSYVSLNGEKGVFGREYVVDELLTEVMKDYRFWKNGGGITFSGGEPLLQAKGLEKLLSVLKERKIHIAFETALMVDKSLLEICIPYVDLFIVDMKILNHDVCKEVLGGTVEKFFNNLEILTEANKEILFRIPCTKEYTLKPENIDRIKSCLREHSHCDVEIFAVHSLARNKYESLAMPFTEYAEISQEELEDVAQELRKCGNRVSVNNL